MVFYYPRHDDVHMKPGSEAQLSTLTKSWSLLAPLPLNTLNYSPHGKFTSIWETNCVCHSGIFKIIPFEQNKMPFKWSVSQFSRSVVSDSLRSRETQHTRPPCLSPIPRVHPNPCPLSQWCHPTISSSVIPSPPALNLSQHQGLFKWVSSSHQVAKVLEFQLQHQSYQRTPRTDLL